MSLSSQAVRQHHTDQTRPHMLKRHPSHVNQCPRRSPDHLADYGCKWQPCNCTYSRWVSREPAEESTPRQHSIEPHYLRLPLRYYFPLGRIPLRWMSIWNAAGRHRSCISLTVTSTINQYIKYRMSNTRYFKQFKETRYLNHLHDG